MKIIFLCGCVEPGKDGVGDYARRLTGELIRQGHNVALLGLNDPYISEASEERQADNDVTIPVLRIPAALPPDSRFKLAKAWVANFNPDWISLQYVPFAFHNKGLDLQLAKQLGHWGKGYKWEVMFHELWVGMESSAALKMKVWGRIQRFLIVKLLNALKPSVIHTQIPLYQAQLHRLGFESSVLPLFSNIPFDTTNELKRKPDQLMFLLFGSIHRASLIEELATEALEYSIKHNLALQLVIIGRAGPEQEIWKEIWSGKGIDVNVMGEQPAFMVSRMMQVANVGIATTPSYLIGKSGTAVTMLEHNLPVINVTREWIPAGVKIDLKLPDGVSDYKQAGDLEGILSGINMRSVKSNSDLKTVAGIFNQSIVI